MSERPKLDLYAYVQIARIDHWFKNVFMLFGVLLAAFYQPDAVSWSRLPTVAVGLLAVCLIASSNYVLNELLDGPTDRLHPVKKRRPVPSGRIRPVLAYAEWLLVGAAGLWLAWHIGTGFFASGLSLWIMGVLYNVPPVRTKEWPYVDVLSEAVNNPLRLLLGWFAIIPDRVPPMSLVLAYWMAGAFFMATKRFAEYRHIADPAVAGTYRKSFLYYTEDRLLVSLVFYATAAAVFAGIFIVRYHVELILLVPLVAGLFSYYLKIGLKPNSVVQYPERLYRERGFAVYVTVCAVVFVVLMFSHQPWMYEWFNVEESQLQPLWSVGR